MENQNYEISLLALWKKIWKNKLLIIIITLVTIIIGTAAVTQINKSGSQLTNDFYLHFVNIEENKYADGSRFDYREIMSLENLNNVKNSDNKFKDINTSKINNDKNSLIRNVLVKDKNEIIDSYYQISISLSHFNNDKALAEAFISGLTSSVLTTAKEKHESLEVYNYFKTSKTPFSVDYLDNLTYEKIFTMIKEQHSLLTDELAFFQTNYGDVRVNGQQISSFKKDFDFWYTNNVFLNQLENQVKTKFYIRNLEETVRIANLNYESNQTEINSNEALINELILIYKDLYGNTTVIDNDSYLSHQIAELAIKNEKLKISQLYFIELKDKTEINIDPEFENLVYEITQELSEYTNQFNEFQQTYLDDNVYYNYRNDVEFRVVVKFNLILMIIIFTMLGVGLGVVTSLIKEADSFKLAYNKNKE